jgi:uncharacterized protein involved in outer membrane biogenesis
MRLGPVLIGVVVLLIVIAVGATIAVQFIDINAYRPAIGRALSAAVAREVTIEGDLTLDLGLRPHFTAERVSVTHRHAAPSAAMAEIGRLDLDLDLRSLLSGVVEITGLRLRDVQIQLTRDADGQPNWTSPPHDEARAEGNTLGVHIARLRAEAVTITYHDSAADRTVRASLRQVTLDDVAYSDTLDIALAGEIDDIPVDLLIELGGSLDVTAVAPHPIELSGAVLGVRTTASGTIDEPWHLRGFTLDVSASAPNLLTIAPVLERELPALGPVTIQGSLTDRDGHLGVDQLAASIGDDETARLTITGAVKDVVALRQVDLRATLRTGDLYHLTPLIGRSPPRTGAIEGRLHLNDHDGVLGIKELALRGGREATLQLEVTGRFADLRHLDDIDLRATLTAGDLSMIGALFDRDFPAIGPVSLSGRLDGSADHVEIEDMAARLGETHFTGEVFGAFVPGTQPRITANLESPRVRLADLGIAPSSSRGAHANAPGGTIAAPEYAPAGSTLGLSRLRALDARVSLRTERIEGRDGFRADQFYGAIRLEDGKLEARPIEVIYQHGSVTGGAEIDARPAQPTLSVHATALGLDVAQILRQVQITQAISGTADLSFNLGAHGDSPEQIAASLAGRADLVIREGTVPASQLDFFARSRLLDWLFSNLDTAQAEVNCLVATFDIAHGVATAHTLVLDAPQLLVEGSGTVDVAHETIDLTLVPKPKHPRLLDVAVPIDLRGPITSPKITANKRKLGTTTTGAVVKSPFGRLQQLPLPIPRFGRHRKDPCAVLVRGASPAP